MKRHRFEPGVVARAYGQQAIRRCKHEVGPRCNHWPGQRGGRTEHNRAPPGNRGQPRGVPARLQVASDGGRGGQDVDVVASGVVCDAPSVRWLRSAPRGRRSGGFSVSTMRMYRARKIHRPSPGGHARVP